MQLPLACSKETLAWLFVYATSAFKLLFFFSFLLFSLAFKLFSSLFWRRREYEYDELYDEDLPEVVAATEEEEEGFGYYSNIHGVHDHLVADVLESEEGLVFLPQSVVLRSSSSTDDHSQFEEPHESFQVGYFNEEDEEDEVVVEEEGDEEEYGVVFEEEAVDEEEVIVEDITGREDSYLDDDFEPDRDLYKNKCSSSITIELDSSATNTQIPQGEQKKRSVEIEHKDEETKKLVREEETKKLSRDEHFLNYAAPRGETKKQLVTNITWQDHQRRHGVVDDHEDEPYADSCTVGSTSKSSSEWRSSITFRDSCTDDPLSSSSRRSCPKWESYTVFQKYDEEMMFLDRISAQKLQEAESLKSLQDQPRSISQRIVHQFATTTTSKNISSDGHYHSNPHYELEAAYVAQVCLAWEALKWDYINFRRKQTLLRQHGTTSDRGCPAQVAQEFQRFLVLLQRYIETEPYEYGKRPEVYARTRRSVAPKLLLVPEYEDYEDDQKEQQAAGSRIPSESFRTLIEDSIRTFMNFLRADRENPYHALLKALFKRKKIGSVDPALVKVLKKANKKKKQKLKELKRGGNKCMGKKKVRGEEEMVILMGEIDLKVVSRVLRMWDLTHEQLRWCEEKMTKVALTKQGKLHRDSTPLFFPAH